MSPQPERNLTFGAANLKQVTILSPLITEQWINDALEDCNVLDIPNLILKPETKSAIAWYKLDSAYLRVHGVTQELINRLHWSLFVYSVGFNEMI